MYHRTEMLLMGLVFAASVVLGFTAQRAWGAEPSAAHLVAGAVACGHFYSEEDTMEDVLKVVALCMSKGPAELTRLGLGIEAEFDKRRPQARNPGDVFLPGTLAPTTETDDNG
jgi:hypothetical protein